MSVLDRSALADSPLADLHAIASELGVDGFRRLRRDDLVDAILAHQGGDAVAAPAADDDEPAARPRRRGGRGRAEGEEGETETPAPREESEAPRRGGRSRAARADEGESPRRRERAGRDDEGDGPRRRERAGRDDEGDGPRRRERATRDDEGDGPRLRERTARDEGDAPRRRRRGGDGDGDGPRRRERAGGDDEGDGPRRRERGGREPRPAADAGEPERVVEGVVELLPNGSGFVRLSPPEASDEDVYVSAAQVRRCELVAGDRVGGPVRPPRRSERHPSLVRVDTINGAPADQVSEGVRFDELPAAFPAERLALASEDPIVQAIDFLAPIGRGSRVTIAGPPRSGKSEALRRLAAALAGLDGIECALVLAGVRPEELGGWPEVLGDPAAALSLTAGPDAQAQAVERAIEHGRRVAARGGDAVVLIDTLDGLHPPAARKALAAARNLAEGGSLTVIATAAAPLGGETTVVALDAELAGARRFPALDLLASGTLRPELLVGEEGAQAIADAIADALA